MELLKRLIRRPAGGEQEMNYGAWRAFASVRENIDNGEITSFAQCYVFVAQMEACYAPRA